MQENYTPLLSKMNFSQKLGLLEALWNEIGQNQESYESPEWHKDILSQRREAFMSGKIKAVDWQEAKERIRKKVSCE